MPKSKELDPEGLVYNHVVYDMMSRFPTLYRCELKAQMALFLRTSNVEVDTEGNIVRLKDSWSEDQERARSKESILGDAPKPRDARVLEDHNWSKFDRGEDCMFYPIGGDLMTWEYDWQEEKAFYKNDVFNHILRGTVKIPESWRQHISMFCYHLEKQDEIAYKAYLLAYIRSAYADVNYQQRYYSMYWDGFLKLREVTPRIREALYPGSTVAKRENGEDIYIKRARELYEAHTKEIISQLPEPKLSAECLIS